MHACTYVCNHTFTNSYTKVAIITAQTAQSVLHIHVFDPMNPNALN